MSSLFECLDSPTIKYLLRFLSQEDLCRLRLASTFFGKSPDLKRILTEIRNAPYTLLAHQPDITYMISDDGFYSRSTESLEFAKVTFPDDFTPIEVVSTGYTSIVLSAQGRICSAGSNQYGLRGIATTENVNQISEVILPNGVRPIRIYAGLNYFLCKTSAGEIYAWGNCFDGVKPYPIKLEFPDNSKILSVHPCGKQCMFISEDAKLYTWGHFFC